MVFVGGREVTINLRYWSHPTLYLTRGQWSQFWVGWTPFLGDMVGIYVSGMVVTLQYSGRSGGDHSMADPISPSPVVSHPNTYFPCIPTIVETLP